MKRALDLCFEQAKRYHQNIDSEEELERLVDADFHFHYKRVKMSHNSIVNADPNAAHQANREMLGMSRSRV